MSLSRRNKYKCTVDGCDRYGPYKLYCTMHYRRVKDTGSPGGAESERPRGTPPTKECTVTGCTSVVRSRKSPYCEMHYYRVRRNGTTDTVRQLVPDAECIVERCESSAFYTDGHCRNHGLGLAKNGDYDNHRKGDLSWNWADDDNVTYEIVHQRVRAWRGPASDYRCVKCGGKARHWAYDHLDPNEKRGMKGRYVLPFSADVEHYHPMCVPCHKRMDLEVLSRGEKEDA